VSRRFRRECGNDSWLDRSGGIYLGALWHAHREHVKREVAMGAS
jgi:hypothetical protein